MPPNYEHLGSFSDLVTARRDAVHTESALSSDKVRELLNFSIGEETPVECRCEATWETDGISGEEVSWSVGYGPRTSAWILRPLGRKERLPGILALHDHGGFKYYGKEKIADGPR